MVHLTLWREGMMGEKERGGDGDGQNQIICEMTVVLQLCVIPNLFHDLEMIKCIIFPYFSRLTD